MKQLISLLLIVGMAACEGPNADSLAYEAADDFEELAEVPTTAPEQKVTVQGDRKLIKTAHLQFETKDLKLTSSTLRIPVQGDLRSSQQIYLRCGDALQSEPTHHL